jgi:anaphase-promoting complex subunit 11
MPLKVKVLHWHAVAAWTWNAGDDVCGICRMPFDGCPPDGKFPGDDSPVVWGVCAHAFHLQCISKWLNSDNEQRCPICRSAWEFKMAGGENGQDSVATDMGSDDADVGSDD